MDILHFYSIPLHTHNISPIYTHTLNTPSSHTLSTNMKTQSNNPLLLIKLLTLHSLLVLSASQDFDFFYFVQQWPGSFCDTKHGCCYPGTGKPASDFGIHGLWPNRNDGSYPSNCDSSNPFDASKISDLMSQMKSDWPTLSCPSSEGLTFWGHEWDKHGTCSETVLDQHGYFSTALSLKTQINLLQALESAGIHPNGSEYSLRSIRDAVKEASGYTPWIECNTDSSGNSQLYQIYLCVDSSGSGFVECPVFPTGSCGSSIEFPSF
ncbi:putative ribonuclease T(2) [Helianthus annuus]|uniref:Putative ribonuclease 1 n=2 Tax=Helianthus annuus TaxID=4232 RepID=A0A251U1W1_HELAN|nr:putative ribonuclease T(2) [Helianthus annuus]